MASMGQTAEAGQAADTEGFIECDDPRFGDGEGLSWALLYAFAAFLIAGYQVERPFPIPFTWIRDFAGLSSLKYMCEQAELSSYTRRTYHHRF